MQVVRQAPGGGGGGGGRSSQGVTIFRTGKDEKVVSVERLPESGGADEADVAGEEGGED